MIHGQCQGLLGQALKLPAIQTHALRAGFLHALRLNSSCVQQSQQLQQWRLLSWSSSLRNPHVSNAQQQQAEMLHEADESQDSQPTPVIYPVPAEGPAKTYWEKRNSGLYRGDPRQEVTVDLLQALYTTLKSAWLPSTKPSGLTLVDNVGVTKKKDSWWAGLSSLLPSPGARSQGAVAPHLRGLYMYGGVGCGKTMLMDVFVEACPSEFKVKRTHFHDFMLHVHLQLREHRGAADPLVRVADNIALQTRVLALDEFFVTDVADAMILNRLFTQLWLANVALVATSNRHPDKLYEGGLQRTLFLPFIDSLKKECLVHDMASTTDYRRLAHHQRGLYFVTPDRGEAVYEQFMAMAHGHALHQTSVEVAMGRQIRVPLAAGPHCMFTFSELCERAVGASDYSALTRDFHTIALSGVPVFTADNRPSAYRFVTLVDIMYEHRTRLLCAADALPFELFENIMTQEEARRANAFDRPDVVIDDNLGFAKDRTISRLTEMQSIEYLIAHAQHNAPELLLALQEPKK